MVYMSQFSSQAITIGLAENSDATVCGPASGAIRALRRIGWSMPSATCMTEANGNVLDLREEAPRTVARAAGEAFQQWAGQRSSLAKRFGGPPDLEALSDDMLLEYSELLDEVRLFRLSSLVVQSSPKSSKPFSEV